MYHVQEILSPSSLSKSQRIDAPTQNACAVPRKTRESYYFVDSRKSVIAVSEPFYVPFAQARTECDTEARSSWSSILSAN